MVIDMKLNDKLKTLRMKSFEDLKKYKLELLKSQFNLRMQKGTKQLKYHHNLKFNRRDIARICTILSEKNGI